MVNKIESILQVTEFREPNTRVPMYEVWYLTEKGHRGSVRVEQKSATQESIAAAVNAAAALPDSLIGTTTTAKR